jgi:hypothetical protein
MLKLFYMDVAKVDRGCYICCKCFRSMLQVFVQNISFVSDVCCKRFDLDVVYFIHTRYVPVCCTEYMMMLQSF